MCCHCNIGYYWHIMYMRHMQVHSLAYSMHSCVCISVCQRGAELRASILCSQWCVCCTTIKYIQHTVGIAESFAYATCKLEATVLPTDGHGMVSWSLEGLTAMCHASLLRWSADLQGRHWLYRLSRHTVLCHISTWQLAP